MNRLEDLPQIANKAMSGLHADETLKNEIIANAEALRRGERVIPRNTAWQETEQQQARRRRLQPVKRMAAMAACGAFVLGLLVGMPLRLSKPVDRQVNDAPAPRMAAAVLNEESTGVLTIQTAGSAPVELEDTMDMAFTMARSVPVNGITIIPSEHPAYRGLWAAAEGANYPLVRVSGCYYRLLTAPTAIGSDLLGESLGTVAEYTAEPALSSAAIVSNTAAEGAEVYAVKGMKGAMIACRVGDELRVFQRVSYGSQAIQSGEKLDSTLKASTVTAMELTGVGTVTDADKARELYSLLTKNAVMSRPAVSETDSVLLLQLENGLTLQLCVRDTAVMACGTWNCPEFFEAFTAAVQ